MLETNIETKTCTAIRTVWREALTPKQGKDGWPDRLVLLGSDRHFWIEFKQAGKPLRPDQYQRCKDLLARGETVLVIDTIEDGLQLVMEIRNAVSAHVACANIARFAQHHAPTLRALRLPTCSRGPSRH